MPVLNGIAPMKIDKHIEIVRSSNKSLSSMGQKSCDMIKCILEQQYQYVGVTTVNCEQDLDILARLQPDLIFLGIKKVPASDASEPASSIWVSDYLEQNGLNYTGSSMDAIALDFDKPEAKRVVGSAGLNTAAYFTAYQNQYDSADSLPYGFPLFIKPPNGGGGKGVGADSVVHDFAAFERKVASIAKKYHSSSLVEKYLQGREFSVAILQDYATDKLLAMPIELIAAQNDQGDRILGQKIKAADTERVISVPAGPVKDALAGLAVKIFHVLGARDYGRIDIRLDLHGIPHFLEANLIPGLACHDFTSYFTSACWTNLAMDYRSMILHIVKLCLIRSAKVGSSSGRNPISRLALPTYPLPLLV